MTLSRLLKGVDFSGGAVVKNLPASAEDTRDEGLIPGSGRPPGVGNGNPLQYSCLENSTDSAAWQASLWGRKELDMTEHAHTHIHTNTLLSA